MRLPVLLSLTAVAAVIAANVPTRVTRASLRTLERSTDANFETALKDEPMTILGQTRGVYLDGYGMVFTTEVELAAAAAVNPFRPAYSKEDIARIKEKKRMRIVYLKENMRGILTTLATSLDTVPLDENVALAVTIPYFRWEDAEGMPKQILLVAPRRALLDARAGKAASLNAALKTQEFF